MEEKEEEKRAEVIREESSTEAPAIKKNPCNNNIFTIQSWLHFSNECTKMAGTWQRTCQYCDKSTKKGVQTNQLGWHQMKKLMAPVPPVENVSLEPCQDNNFTPALWTEKDHWVL